MLVSSRGPANIHQSEHQLKGQKSFWFLFREQNTFVVFFQCQLLQFLIPLIRDNIREICTTVYALAYMEIKFPSRHEWELVARKAEVHCSSQFRGTKVRSQVNTLLIIWLNEFENYSPAQLYCSKESTPNSHYKFLLSPHVPTIILKLKILSPLPSPLPSLCLPCWPSALRGSCIHGNRHCFSSERIWRKTNRLHSHSILNHWTKL